MRKAFVWALGAIDDWTGSGRSRATGPHLLEGHCSRAREQCEKWAGSHRELLGFARHTVKTAAPGDPRTVVLPIAHFEILRRRLDDTTEPASKGASAYFGHPAHAAELAWAADCWLSRAWAHPTNVGTAHLFGAALYYSGDLDRARYVLGGAGNRMPEHLPWGLVSPLPGRTYRKVRRELGLR
ncbi:hypothetical protein [Nocardiopsis ansamitocini]|uniref:hypothetical protein n=1 Tax=Nocardiopsis ansamitocini TaxID=1670832 RepID=UPI002554DC9E|nr:hypothetical protein [Nocardiopsis ansamitocini]